jgi:preprotein translocase subunit SecG
MNTDTIAAIIFVIFLVSCILVSYVLLRRLRGWGIGRIQGSPRLGGQTAKMRDALRRGIEESPPPESK